ncbi:hypothetical protein OPV09_25600 [Janthinobacterium sp. TB1-E2]|uniref:Uncharacterized protein n=1 Tax=Janthinobacterium aestuarii TaxID=2985511 RepID=A0ABZ2GPS9_9BURK|nr:hypothetical protein [Janthinobacterium lividum]
MNEMAFRHAVKAGVARRFIPAAVPADYERYMTAGNAAKSNPHPA